MSVPGLTQVTPDALAQALIHVQHAPIQPDSPTQAPVAPSGQSSAQSALDEFLNGETPDDASIGFYSDTPQAEASLDQQILAQDISSGDLAQLTLTQATLSQATLAANQQAQTTQADTVQVDRGAATEIARTLEDALAQTPHADLAANLQELLQTIGNGAADEIVATTARLQSAFAPTGAPSLATTLAFALASATTAQSVATLAPSQAPPAVAAFDALASVARTIQAELEAALPADWLTALATAIPAATNALPQVDPYANPLLLAFQLGVLIGVKTTLNEPAPFREDRMVILPILGLGECDLHADGREDE